MNGRAWGRAGAVLLGVWLLTLPMCQRLSWRAWMERRRTWQFPLERASTVRVQAWQAEGAKITQEGSGTTVRLSAKPRLLPQSYHGSEPVPHEETDAQKWPFAWGAERAGSVLRLRSTGEVKQRYHRYQLDDLEIAVPAGVTVKLERQALEER